MIDVSKDLKRWKDEIKIAKEICKKNALQFDLSPHAYQLATIKSYDVSLVLYPHRTSSSHYHIRVRNQSSKNKEEATKIISLLNLKVKIGGMP